MTIPYTFANATTAIPLAQLDSNFASPITLGNVAMTLSNTYTSIGNLTLANVTITSGSINSAITQTYGNANAVVFTNSSNVATTSTALTFNGTNLGIGNTNPANPLSIFSASSSNASIISAADDGSGNSLGVLVTYATGAPQTNPRAVLGMSGYAGYLKLYDSGNTLRTTLSTSGLTFNNSSATNNSTLNDYEAGTWTPTLRGNSTAGSATYSSQLGYYTKVGRVVTASFDIITSSTLSGTSAVQVVLPFTVGGSGIAGGAGVCGYFSAIVGSVGQLVMYLDSGNNIANLVYTAAGAGSGQSYLATSAIQNGTRISGVVQYIANF